MGALGSAALMGASGFMTVVYAITKINYTYEIPLFLVLTLRGAGTHPCVNAHAPRRYRSCSCSVCPVCPVPSSSASSVTGTA